METRPEVIVEVARIADSLGYESVTLPEGWGLDSTVILTQIALATEQIRPTSCILSVWGRTPATIAMNTATLSAVSEGRYVLGLGTSTPQLAEGFHDIPFRTPTQKLADVTRQVRRLLQGERIEPSVETELRALRLGQPPVPDQEIHIAATGPRARRVAAQLGDGWMPVFLTLSTLQGHIAEHRQWRAEAGLDADRFTTTAGPLVAIDDNRDRAKARVASNLAWYMCSMGDTYPELARRQGFSAEVDAIQQANPEPRPGRCVVPPAGERLLDEFGVYGTADDVAAGLARWQETVDLVMVGLSPGESLQDLEALVRAGAP